MNRQFGEMPSFMPPQEKNVSLPPRRINEKGFGITLDTDSIDHTPEVDIIEPTPEMDIDHMLQTYYLALQALPQESRIQPGSSGREIAMQYAELLFDANEMDVDPITKENLLDTAARMLQSDALSGSESAMQDRIQATWDRILDNTDVRKAA
jgi:hypothetical protein